MKSIIPSLIISLSLLPSCAPKNKDTKAVKASIALCDGANVAAANRSLSYTCNSGTLNETIYLKTILDDSNSCQSTIRVGLLDASNNVSMNEILQVKNTLNDEQMILETAVTAVNSVNGSQVSLVQENGIYHGKLTLMNANGIPVSHIFNCNVSNADDLVERLNQEIDLNTAELELTSMDAEMLNVQAMTEGTSAIMNVFNIDIAGLNRAYSTMYKSYQKSVRAAELATKGIQLVEARDNLSHFTVSSFHSYEIKKGELLQQAEVVATMMGDTAEGIKNDLIAGGSTAANMAAQAVNHSFTNMANSLFHLRDKLLSKVEESKGLEKEEPFVGPLPKEEARAEEEKSEVSFPIPTTTPSIFNQ